MSKEEKLQIINQYLEYFRKECQSLPKDEKKEIENVLLRGNDPEIFLKLEHIRENGLINSKEFEKKLTEYYWLIR